MRVTTPCPRRSSLYPLRTSAMTSGDGKSAKIGFGAKASGGTSIGSGKQKPLTRSPCYREVAGDRKNMNAGKADLIRAHCVRRYSGKNRTVGKTERPRNPLNMVDAQ